MEDKRSHYQLNVKALPKGPFALYYPLDIALCEQGRECFDLAEVNVEASIEGEKVGEVCQMQIHLEGSLQTVCDRCGEALVLPICETFPMVVKLGVEADEISDEEIVLPFDRPLLDLGNLLYQLLIVSMPMRRVHPIGACSEASEQFYVHQENKAGPLDSPFSQLLEQLEQNNTDNN